MPIAITGAILSYVKILGDVYSTPYSNSRPVNGTSAAGSVNLANHGTDMLVIGRAREPASFA